LNGGAKRIFFNDADLESTVDFFHHGISTLVAPGQRAMILLPGNVGNRPVKGLAGQIKTVLLSNVCVSDAIKTRLHRAWSCRVFKNYGMTEMGLGGAVESTEKGGCHVREADLLIEIIDPAIGQTVPDGSTGENVFATLTREGMPLIRYRTGDMSAFMVAPCCYG